MNRVDVSAQNTPIPDWIGDVESFILQVLEYMEIDDWEVSILFCDDDFIRDLNGRYRGKDESTDVLSFASHYEEGENSFSTPETYATISAGDIVISVQTLQRQAREWGVSLDEELQRILIHGVLHLAGMDHATNSFEDEEMLRKQEKILRHVRGETVF
ncbi:MAG TPA: rRNA maturation RNase YbeY [Sediminispirochaeta sp.]|nr:rRNA maturation RNase YbeY [Sediminispirochaeta sp.]